MATVNRSAIRSSSDCVSVSILSSVTWVYIYVVSTRLCPNILLIVSIGTPCERAISVAKVCLAIWKVNFRSMPQTTASCFNPLFNSEFPYMGSSFPPDVVSRYLSMICNGKSSKGISNSTPVFSRAAFIQTVSSSAVSRLVVVSRHISP